MFLKVLAATNVSRLGRELWSTPPADYQITPTHVVTTMSGSGGSGNKA